MVLYPSSFDAKHEGAKSVIGKMVDQTSEELRWSFRNKSISVSTVASHATMNSLDNQLGNHHHLYPNKMWAIGKDEKEGGGGGGKGGALHSSEIEATVNSLTHSLLSPRPLKSYNRGGLIISIIY